jgi:hypothetical protein
MRQTAVNASEPRKTLTDGSLFNFPAIIDNSIQAAGLYDSRSKQCGEKRHAAPKKIQGISIFRPGFDTPVDRARKTT